ncbi:MAG: family transporter [Proteobacteria bacterium]|nr:family transporter [Pseudomonadota bacterium]
MKAVLSSFRQIADAGFAWRLWAKVMPTSPTAVSLRLSVSIGFSGFNGYCYPREEIIEWSGLQTVLVASLQQLRGIDVLLSGTAVYNERLAPVSALLRRRGMNFKGVVAMRWKQGLGQAGVAAALSAALLFGAGIPFAKLLHSLSPWLLAGLLYLGAGIGLTLQRWLNKAPPAHFQKDQLPWFVGAVVTGGVLGPVLLMFGLSGMPAAGASLLLNAEGLFTALLAWFAFKENFDRRVLLGMSAIIVGAIVLSWPGEASFAGIWPSLAVLGACLAWGVDNNLTRLVSLGDATWIAAVKGLVAGSVNLLLAISLGTAWPPLINIAAAMLLGFLAYGVSLALFVVGLRHLGTARTGAYFSVAPFVGALIAVFLGDPVTVPLLIAGACMALGIWLHLTEQHEHPHEHPGIAHDHEHVHDEHHQHAHAVSLPAGSKHRHLHQHAPLTHSHHHFPDSHHLHPH